MRIVLQTFLTLLIVTPMLAYNRRLDHFMGHHNRLSAAKKSTAMNLVGM